MKKADIREGNILSVLIFYTTPIVLTNLLQVMYNAADSIIVGMSKEADAVGAVGTASVFITFVLNLIIGCSVGTKVIMARSLGEKNEDFAGKVLHTSMAVGIILGILCGVVGFFVSEPVLAIMGNRGRLLKLATLYTKIYFFSAPFVSVTNFAVSALQANGDSKTPMKVLTFTGLINVCLNWVFVKCFSLSVEGVGMATVISTAISAILLVICLKRNEGVCRLEVKKIRVSKEALFKIMYVGIPIGIQNSLFSFSHMMIQSSVLYVNNLISGVQSAFQPVVKGCAACTSIESLASTVASSVGQGAVSFIAQNAGAKNYERVIKGKRIWYCAVFVVLTVVAWALICFKDPLLALYGVSRNSGDALREIAYNSAVTRIKYMFIPYFLLGFMEVGSAVAQGLGRTLCATLVSIFGSCAFRVIWILSVFKIWPTLEVIFISFPVSWAITAFIHYILGRREIKKCLKSQCGALCKDKRKQGIV